jgi:serine/threonine-protein kinase
VLAAGYRLRRLRGRGNFGQVWEAETTDGKIVALKFLNCGESRVAAQELRNTLTVRQLSHPGLVRIDRVWSDRKYLVLAMEVADGSLQELLGAAPQEGGSPLSGAAVCAYLSQAAAVLDFLNARRHMVGGLKVGVQHCDVKPSNLLVFGQQVKLADFGLASVTTGTDAVHRRAGTLAYAAPEVFQGRLSDWTDQYALAVTYCELRGGRLPFPDTPDQFVSGYVRPTPDLQMLPEAERPIVTRALARTPPDRWPCCAEFVGRLAALNGEAPVRVEMRAQERYLCPRRPVIRLMVRSTLETRKATVVNVSKQGLGLVVDGELLEGTQFALLAPCSSADDSRILSAEVVRVRAQPGATWYVGCRLITLLSDAEVQSFVNPPERRS